jgi:hypothetical protein
MSGKRCPIDGKRKHASYVAALAEFDRLVALRGMDPSRASIYECLTCGAWHISSRRFTLVKPRGRGKRRRGIVYKRHKGRGAA